MHYLGFAHGLMGVLYCLMDALPLLAAEDTERARKEVVTCLGFVLNHEREEGRYPTRCLESRSTSAETLCHWCHGSSGAALLFAKAARVFREETERAKLYAAAAVRAGDVVWREGLLRKGVGLCHGVAGNGYALLAVSRMPCVAEDVQHRFAHRARMFADWVVSDEGQSLYGVPDNAGSLFEGLAGAACFLMDVDASVSELDLCPSSGLPFVQAFRVG